MNNERPARDAVALYSSVQDFVRRFRNDLGECTAQLPSLLDPLAELADEILHGSGVSEVAQRVLDAIPQTSDLPMIVAHVASMRTCLAKVWERENGADYPAALRALHAALDRVIQLVVERAVTVARLDRQRMEDELRQAVRTREDLIAVVSHDLRNPLGTITLGATMMVADDTLSARTRKHAVMIERSAHRMERLIDDLLDIQSVQRGTMSLRLEKIAARQAVLESVESQQPLANDKGIELVARTHGTDVHVLCDPERIQRVFANLVGNALKFCRHGDRIEIAAQTDGDVVRFVVEDTGPGIDPNALPYVFDPYWSAPEHARRGVGLGLFITRGIIAAHGGRIWVESELGRGTRFSFTLPVSR